MGRVARRQGRSRVVHRTDPVRRDAGLCAEGSQEPRHLPSLVSRDPVNEAAPHDPYRALRESGFRRYLTGNLVGTIGFQMQGVAVGWELYERTHSAFALGIVGLVQVVP